MNEDRLNQLEKRLEKIVDPDADFDSYEGISKEERELYNSVPPSSSMTPKSREEIESLHEELQSKVDDENLSRREKESAYEELQAYVDDIDDEQEHFTGGK